MDAVRAAPVDQQDLVLALEDAARSAIRDQRQSLTYRPESLRSVVLELEVDTLGQVVGGTCYVERTVGPLRSSRR